MSDQVFIVNLLAMGGATVVQEDQLPGLNWIVIEGSFDIPCEIDLSYAFEDGVTQSSSGIYYIRTDGGNILGSRLIVSALCENAQGSDGEDFIQGNEVSNIIKGDSGREGTGLTIQDDTLWGGAGGDTIYGGDGADGISGDEGRDLLFGDGGFDLIQGGSEIDTIEGGLGADTLSGGADLGDVLSYRESTGGVTIDITYGETTTGAGGHAEGDRINGFTDVRGSDLDDVITDTDAGTIAFQRNDNRFDGWDGDDVLEMGGGDDTAYGGIGADLAFGGIGSDVLKGDEGEDSLQGGDDGDKLYGGDDSDLLVGDAGKDRLFGDGGNDRLSGGDENDTLDGGSQGDRLRGGDGNDSLVGGDGWDDLYGNKGRDTLVGGTGVDDFFFLARSDSGITAQDRDTIVDFDRTLEVIHVDAIDAIAGTAGDDAFTFQGRLGFDGAGQIRIKDYADGILVLLNTDADSTPEMSIYLQGVFVVDEANFAL
jgi:serralysin